MTTQQKFRAIIDGVEYKFTLQELLRCTQYHDCSPCTIVICRETRTEWMFHLVDWLAASNQPDRFTELADIYENDILRNTYIVDGQQQHSDFKVVFKHGQFWLNHIGSDDYFVLTFDSVKGLKVVGNTHEVKDNA